MNNISEEQQKYIKCVSTKCDKYFKEYLTNFISILNKIKIKINDYKNNKIEIDQVIDLIYNSIIKIITSMNNKKYLKCIMDNCSNLFNDYITLIKKDPRLNIFFQYKISKSDVQMIFKQDVVSDIEKLKKIMESFFNKKNIDIDTLTKYSNDFTKIIKKLLKIAYTNNKNFILMIIKNKINKLPNKDDVINKIIKFIDILKNLFKDKDKLMEMIKDPNYMKKIMEKEFEK